jgi:hypothetical protein
MLTRYFCLLALVVALPASGQTDQVVYGDALANGWITGWSWSATIDPNRTSNPQAGSKCMAVTLNGAWGAIYFHRDAFSSSPYESLSFWINPGATGNRKLSIQAALSAAAQPGVSMPALTPNTWQRVIIPLADLHVLGKPDLDGFWIQDQTGAAQTVFYLDTIQFTASSVPLPEISLTSPADGSSFASPASIPLAAQVTANGHALTKVQFLDGGTVLGEDTAAPYVFTWTNASIGPHTVSCRLVYDVTNSLDSTGVGVTVTGTTPVTVKVDAQRGQRPISPLIYGVAFAASAADLTSLNAPIHRSGGNSETRYNWLINAHNRGSDWYFESLPDSPAVPGAAADGFVTKSKSGGAEPMLTVPMIGWVPKLGANGDGRLASYSISKYGAQTGNDAQWFTDAGNGISTSNNTPITWNDPNDANFSTNSTFQQVWIQHLTNQWGRAGSGGVRYYCMDNEHSLWHSTHRDVHPTGATMAEIRDKFFDYAAKVKSTDPGALLVAPEEWGWSGYFYSGYDQQYGSQHGWSTFPDRNTNGGWDYMPWLLNQFRQRATTTGQRLLDYFSLHFYPQSGEFSDDITSSMQLQRNRSTRVLWDTNYTDPSWIGSVVKLIPRMREWVDTFYPGTKIAITEYNWGAEGHINGATAQADIYGIFGREGLDLATRWTTPPASSPTFKAMKMYRNYDGSGSGFGDTSVLTVVPNPDLVSAFGATRSSDGALTVMVVNKQSGNQAAISLALTNFPHATTAQVWQLTSGNAISRLTDVPVPGSTLTSTVPAQSISLFVIPPAHAPSLEVSSGAPAGTFSLRLIGSVGQSYRIEATTNLLDWVAVQTNQLTGTSTNLNFPATGSSRRFYRAQWLP